MASRSFGNVIRLASLTEDLVNAYPGIEVKVTKSTNRNGRSYDQLQVTYKGRFALQRVPVLHWRNGDFIDRNIVTEQATRLIPTSALYDYSNIAAFICTSVKQD